MVKAEKKSLEVSMNSRKPDEELKMGLRTRGDICVMGYALAG